MRVYIVLVTGKTGGVAHVVGRVMQDGALQYAGDGDQPYAKRKGKQGRHYARLGSLGRYCLGRHFLLPP
jgi:hypothetical protein